MVLPWARRGTERTALLAPHPPSVSQVAAEVWGDSAGRVRWIERRERQGAGLGRTPSGGGWGVALSEGDVEPERKKHDAAPARGVERRGAVRVRVCQSDCASCGHSVWPLLLVGLCVGGVPCESEVIVFLLYCMYLSICLE